MMKKITVLAIILVLVLASVSMTTGTTKAQNSDSLVVWADEILAPAFAPFAQAFEDEYGVPVEVQQFNFDDIRNQFTTSAPAGEGPDVLIGPHDWVGEFVANGLISPVDISGVADHLNENAVAAFTYNGDVYGLPYAVDNTAFFRNTDLVPDRPATWDEVRTISEQLADQGIYGYMIQNRDPWHSYTVVSAFGGYVFGYDPQTGYDPTDVGLDSEGTIAAYTYLGNLIKDGLMPSGLQQESMWELFTTGKGAMMVTGSWALPTIRESDVNFEVTPAPDGPAGPARPFLSVRGFMVSAFSNHPTEAQTFVTQYMATDESMQALFDAEERPPAWDGVVVEDPAIEAFRAAGATGAFQPAIPEMGAVWESWSNQMELSLLDPSVAAQEAKNAADQVRAAIAGD